MSRIMILLIAVSLNAPSFAAAKPKYDVWAYYQKNRDSYWRHYKPNVGEIGYQDRQPNVYGYRAPPKKKEPQFFDFFGNIFNGRGE